MAHGPMKASGVILLAILRRGLLPTRPRPVPAKLTTTPLAERVRSARVRVAEVAPVVTIVPVATVIVEAPRLRFTVPKDSDEVFWLRPVKVRPPALRVIVAAS